MGDQMSKYQAHDENGVIVVEGWGIQKIRSDGPDAVVTHIHWDGRFQFNSDL